MEQSIIDIGIFIIRALQAVAGTFAGVKLAIYGIGYMRKNQQKIEEAKEGMKNVGIGLVVVMGCQALVMFLQNNVSF
ncbi:pilin [Bacillus sp. Au-Bac7]|uniref:pilin n=1 Tax=Bacillus sp. Au-Bac7 TaxID=2906458 RepID=UPI001E41FD4D|nr:pilin [Bacillus sp. Au-Bac7]MCE4051680.1 pilin [Bacillus sp. Au-Bac7]